MNRREIVALMCGAAAFRQVLLHSAIASDPPLLVWFASATELAASRWMGFLQDGLKEQGYSEGQNYRLVGRFAEFHVERLPDVARDVVRLNPTIIVAGASDTAVAAKKLTSTIPTVSGALA